MSYVPDPAKFEVQKTLPDAVKNLSDEQRAGLRGIASHVHAGVAAKDLHDIVYAGLKSGISASKMFQAICIPIPGKRLGPKRGVLHGAPDREFLSDRLRAAGG